MCTFKTVFALLLLVVVVVGVSAVTDLQEFRDDPDYTYWCLGNCNQDVSPAVHHGLIIMGGGTDVDDAFKQQIEWSGHGDFVVLRTSGDNAYNPYIYTLEKVNSVTTFLLKNRNASTNAFVLQRVNQSEAIFFAGGDQSTYVNFWQQTPLQEVILNLTNVKGIPIGGTSAGCAILGDFIYTAENDTVESSEALANPYDYRVTLGHQFLNENLLNITITDPHFVTRDRMGRLVTFLARLIQDGWSASVRGIGVDEQTAIALDAATGIGQSLGNGTAYFLHTTNGPSVCKPNTPLTFVDVHVQEIEAKYGDAFDFKTWSGGVQSDYYRVDAVTGIILQSDPYTPPDSRDLQHA